MQGSLFGEPTQAPLLDAPAAARESEEASTVRALDELFLLTDQYRSSSRYKELLDFVAKFRFY